jgi:predicted DNA-binding transcriptional regulator AlpA
MWGMARNGYMPGTSGLAGTTSPARPTFLAVINKGSAPAPTPESQLYLTEVQVVLRFGLSVRTLQDWRLRGTGPRFTVLSGRTIRYALADLEAWEASLPKRRSTSEDGGNKE